MGEYRRRRDLFLICVWKTCMLFYFVCLFGCSYNHDIGGLKKTPVFVIRGWRSQEEEVVRTKGIMVQMESGGGSVAEFWEVDFRIRIALSENQQESLWVWPPLGQSRKLYMSHLKSNAWYIFLRGVLWEFGEQYTWTCFFCSKTTPTF